MNKLKKNLHIDKRKLNYKLIILLIIMMISSHDIVVANDDLNKLIHEESGDVLNPETIKNLKKSDQVIFPSTNPPIINTLPIAPDKPMDELKISPVLVPEIPKLDKNIQSAPVQDNKIILSPVQIDVSQNPVPSPSEVKLIHPTDSISNIPKPDNISIVNNDKKIKYDNKNKQLYNLSNWNGSLLFKKKEISSLDEAFKNFLTGNYKTNNISVNGGMTGSIKNAKDFIKAIEPKFAPSFYLNSIFYKNSKDWTIWLNQKQIKSTEPLMIIDELVTIEVIDINRKNITIKWKTDFLSNYCPAWQDILSIDPTLDYCSANKNIIVDNKGYMITFKLGLNQTFVSHDMTVKEGFYDSQPIVRKEDSINKQ